MRAEEIKYSNTLRIIALATRDDLIRDLALDVLNETEGEVRSKLLDTCWCDSVDNIREAVEEDLKQGAGDEIL